MIRYPLATPAEIRRRITAIEPQWAGKAASETDLLIAAGRFTLPKPPAGSGTRVRQPPSIWAEVKIVYMELQHFKCIFCERALAERDGKIEHDVEHFRPKNAIVAWKPPKNHPAVAHVNGPAAASGYYWLAYTIENYAAACKPCNSTEKSNFFPIIGARGQAVEPVATLNKHEKPLLIFPMNEDPEALITFRGIVAVPIHKAGAKFLRGITTIALFNLNGRGELWEDRFRAIRAVFQAFALVNTGGTQAIRDDAVVTITELTAAAAPQSACAKAYLETLRSDPAGAWEIYQEARAFVGAQR